MMTSFDVYVVVLEAALLCLTAAGVLVQDTGDDPDSDCESEVEPDIAEAS